MTTTTLITKLYNLDNYRGAVTANEIRALLEGGPHLLGLCECAGNSLPGVGGYKLIRDTSRPGRENIAAYVSIDVVAPLEDVRWHDCEETWTKTNPGATGQHWPRSWLEFRLNGMQIIVGHQPPKGTDNVKASQQEGIDLLVRRMAPWTRDDWAEKTDEQKDKAYALPRVALADYNRGPNEDGPGPRQLVNKIDGWQLGQQIDAAVCRGGDCSPKDAKYVHEVKGVTLGSDHHDALIARVLLEAGWL